MDKTKILYACRECGVLIACENIFSKDNIVVCDYCPVNKNCNMRAVPLKYAETFKINQKAYCDACHERREDAKKMSNMR